MKTYYLYLFRNPYRELATKIGYTTGFRPRLSVYQNAAYAGSYIARFDIVYYGTEVDIRTMESQIKYKFRSYIDDDSAGCSEWIAKHTPNQLEKVIDGLITRNGHNIKKIPSDLLPVTLYDYEKVYEYVDKKMVCT